GPRDVWGSSEGHCVADIAGVERLIETEVKSLGYDLVRVAMIGGTSDPTLQVMAERPDTRQLDLSDCERISRCLSETLDLADPIDGRKQFAGTLEGLDGDTVKLTDKAGHDHTLPFSEISSAKLLLTDKLIKATAPLSTEGADTIKMEG